MTFIDTWDSLNAAWDSGLSWDINIGPATDVTSYLDLITSAHRDKPKFVATVGITLQPLADLMVVLKSIPGKFDLDVATNSQLDAVGEWIGASRILQSSISNVYFAWDTPGLGWNQGTWWKPGLDLANLLVLPDEQYRTLLRARAAANNWDGTIPNAYEVWDLLFAGTDFTINMVDHQDMTMDFVLHSPTPPDALTLALVTGNFLTLKPAGVHATATAVSP